MRLTSLPALERHLADVGEGGLACAYTLISKDSFEIKQGLELLSQCFFSQQPQAHGMVSLDGENLSLHRLCTALEASELFVKKQLVAIFQADKLSKGHIEAIQRYLSRPISSICLVVVAATLLRTTNFYKSLEKQGVVFETSEGKARQTELADWIIAYLAQNGKKIEAAAISYLIQSCHGERFAIYNEMEKLVCNSGDSAKIALSDVKKFVTYIPEENIWQLADALLSCQPAKARAIAQQVMANDSDFFAFVRLMRSQFQMLCQIASILSHSGSQQQVQQQFPQQPFGVLRRNIALAEAAGLQVLQKALIKIDETELKAKNSQGSFPLLVDMLLAQLSV